MELLFLLVGRRGELVSREEIAQRLWGKDVFLDVDHSINTAVRKIRVVLRDDPEKPRFLETVVGKGYRFAASVTCTDGRYNQPHLPAEASQSPPVTPAEALPPSRPSTLSPTIRPIKERAFSLRMVTVLGVAAVLAIMAAVVILKYENSRAESAKVPVIRSLAVLPLANLSGDPNQDYLADGMTEALIGRLGTIHGLRVISRTSSMSFKGSKLAIPEIARALHVDAVVEGSVIRSGNRIRVSAQLIRGDTDTHFWSQTYDRELRDVLALQNDVAQSIAMKVEVTLTGEEYQRLRAARPVAPEVYESYLEGRFALNNHGGSRSGVEESIGYFQDAIKQDPTFAPSYVGMAAAYSQLGTVFLGGEPEKTRGLEESALQKALQLDPELADAHVLLANLEQKEWHWKAAEAEYRRALELAPNDATAHAGLAQWLLCQGRTDEALQWAQRGRELNPLAVSGANIGGILFQSHRYPEAERELRSTIALEPDDPDVLWSLGFVLIARNQPQQAIPFLEKALTVSGRAPGVIGVLIRAYAHAERRNDALRLLAELKSRKRKGYVPAGAFVNAYLGLGDNEQALVWLEQAYQEQSNILQFVKVHPYFDPLRSDPRFADLVRRVGLG